MPHGLDAKSIETLELPKILERVAALTAFSAGRERALSLTPTNDPETVRRRLAETREARDLLARHPNARIGGARDIREEVEQAQKGGVLSPITLLDIRQTIIAGRRLRSLILRNREHYPALARIADRIEPCEALDEAIAAAIDDNGDVRDDASPKLRQLRRDIAMAHDRLLEKLRRIISDPNMQRWLQEPIITQRGDRYVIPVKAEHKGRVRGVVHDQSSSGATVFIEPLETLDLNNQWRELQIAEQHEIERILRELSDLVAENSDELIWTVEALADLDLAFAKAEYADRLRAVEPELSDPASPPRDQPLVNLHQARHPLLDPETVVPIDVWLGPDFRILVITGPNTGGKTVTLKTVGLLTLMTMCGLHIPAAEGSRVALFDNVFADIGDEQSIEQSLSTFSSHLTNITRILRAATPSSLVLLDEVGAGTDPVEGAALAQALLMHLLERGIWAIVATHYSELKVWAHITPGVKNASVEFDLETLRPTYHLRIGLPGQSNAIAIAQRLGLDPAIIEQARALLSSHDIELEALLADIKQTRDAAQAEAEEVRREREALEQTRRELERRLAELEHERIQLLNQAREEARRELEGVRAHIRDLMQRLARYADQQEELRAIRREIDQIEKEELAPLKAPPLPDEEPAEEPVPDGPIQVGDTVWVPALGRTGDVIALDGDEAEIAAGAFRLRLPLDEVQRRPQKKQPAQHAAPTVPTPPRRVAEAPPLELDLRGMRVDDMLPVLDKYLDDAYLAGVPSVRIIHGKGTGALRRAVREQLRNHPLVATFRPGDTTEGGDGVTVVQLNLR
ncbi:DNA mismatch repair protein MutS2 [Ardenticatena maritima]|uniref:Endonuclease MutS2 n=1 Tax=Ardenticatena maritima TaxID=872965 RepID=A0A0M8K7F2_9CHLR|nr:endonuclease MutS2 [Ardenticatena maritima]KPL87730.1 hypothetical protein SE16_09065 [Ardenticatena maritima]GAP63343.1 DNA mismatch repair protein MutS2 [Ardenticatena maritima]